MGMIEIIVERHDNGKLVPVKELVRCKDCMKGTLVIEVGMLPFIRCFGEEHELDWFCADGKRR